MLKTDIRNEGKNIEIKIYGEIGDSWFEEDKDENSVNNLDELDKALKENKDAGLIDVYINSEGGSVFDGIAIYNMLKRHKAYKRIFIEGFACSIASVIAMAGNKIVMPKSSMMMIHNAWCVGMGNAKEFRKLADDLDKMNELIVNAYTKKTKQNRKTIEELMDKESYLSAEECLKMGFCTDIADNLEDTEKKNAKAMDGYIALMQNKLDTLDRIRNAISSIDLTEEEEEEEEVYEAVETLEVNETPEEVETEEAPAEETNEAEPSNEAEAKVAEIKENALKRFFNLEEKGEKE